MHHPTYKIAHTTVFVTQVVEHRLEREIAQCVHHEGSIQRPITPWANALTTELHLAPYRVIKNRVGGYKSDAFLNIEKRKLRLLNILVDVSLTCQQK